MKTRLVTMMAAMFSGAGLALVVAMLMALVVGCGPQEPDLGVPCTELEAGDFACTPDRTRLLWCRDGVETSDGGWEWVQNRDCLSYQRTCGPKAELDGGLWCVDQPVQQ